MAAAFRHEREARRRLEVIGGGLTCTWCPESDAEAGGKDRASARQGGTHGAVGRLLGAGRQGLVEVCHGRQDGAELGHERLDEARLRGDHACSGREWRRVLDGVEALINHVGIAPRRGVEEALSRSTTRQRSGVEGRPWGETVTAERGVLVVTPC
jgi:hypothetical protein